MVSDTSMSSRDVHPCGDVIRDVITVASDAQLQQRLLIETAERKTAEHRANCLHKLLTDLRNTKVWVSSQSFTTLQCCSTEYAPEL